MRVNYSRSSKNKTVSVQRLITITLFLGILLPGNSYLWAHTPEKISVTSLEQSQGRLLVKIKVFVEDLQPRLAGMDPEKGFNYYLRKPFDSDIQKPIENYINSEFKLLANNVSLRPKFQNLTWVEEFKNTDHAMVNIHLAFDLPNGGNIKTLKIQNSIFLKNIYEQRNLINVKINDFNGAYILTKGNESVIINF